MATPVRSVTSANVAVGDPTRASHYNNLRTDVLTALTEFDYGDTAELPVSPALGQQFLDKQADVLYACFDVGTWQAIASDQVAVDADGVKIAALKKLFLDGGVDTWIDEVSDGNIRFVINNAERLRVSASSVDVSAADISVDPTKRVYFDTFGDTYIHESVANVVELFAGGSRSVTFVATGIAVDATDRVYFDGGLNTYITEVASDTLRMVLGGVTGHTFRLDSVSVVGRLYLDGPNLGDTYIHESSANVAEIVVASSIAAQFLANNVNLFAAGVQRFSTRSTGLAMAAGDRFNFDGVGGSGDTYVHESSSNVISFVAGGTSSFSIGVSSLSMPALHKLYFDGGSDTYIHESAANTVEIVTNGSAAARFDSVGDLSINGGYETFDEYDDLALIRSMDFARSPDQVIRTRFDDAMKSYSREFLEESRLMSFEDSGQSFWNVTQTVRLHQGALGQVATLLYNVFERLQKIDDGPGLFEALKEERLLSDG